MTRLIALAQLSLAAILWVFALLCLLNIVFIAPREETISVVNAFIGLGVLLVFLSAMARIIWKKGMANWRHSLSPDSTNSTGKVLDDNLQDH